MAVIIFVFVVFMIFFGLVSGIIALAKNRNFLAWFALGALFGIFPFLYLAFSEPRPPRNSRTTAAELDPRDPGLTADHRAILAARDGLKEGNAASWDDKMAALDGWSRRG